MSPLTIVGAGALALSLGTHLSRLGRQVPHFVVRDLQTTRKRLDALGIRARVTDIATVTSCNATIAIAVNDDAIESVCGMLAQRGLVHDRSQVLHFSGALESDALAAAAEQGAAIASLHPLQTFSDPVSGAERFEGIHWFFEGQPGLSSACQHWVESLGGIFHRIAHGNKVLYHASAVLACNYLTALLDCSQQCAAEAGLEPGEIMPALLPLVQATLDGFERQGAGNALTGPIARGDHVTVSKHLQAMANLPELDRVYRALGQSVTRIAEKSGRIDADRARVIRELLK